MFIATLIYSISILFKFIKLKYLEKKFEQFANFIIGIDQETVDIIKENR